jgi:hypothetical protein
MSDSDQVAYLTRDPRKFDSKLRQMIESAKVSRMPSDQWMAYIKGLGSKGVKAVDVEDSGVMPWLQGSAPDSPQKGQAVDKAALLEAIDRYSVTVKEVVLGRPQYDGWHHGVKGTTPYQEILFIANSERANLEDRLEEIEFEMESLGFDLARLAEDPSIVLRLEAERAQLIKRAPTANDFAWSHFRANDIEGKHGKNLLAHARVTIHDDLYFIEEIQSDWGQRGRIKKSVNDQRRAAGMPELSWNDAVPRGPFVTDTKLWAGLVLRRLLQRAAMLPQIRRVAWISIHMKNGAKVNPGPLKRARKEEIESVYQRALAQAQLDGTEPPARPVDDTDHFYGRLIPSLAESAIGKAGGKVRFGTETICDVQYDGIPVFDMTDQVRESLKGVQPLYSAASVLRSPKPIPDQRLIDMVRDAREMIGSTVHIRFVEKLCSLSDMRPMSGSYVNNFINVALNSVDVKKALRHESYHFAHDKLLDRKQRSLVLEAFAPGTELNGKVRDLLLRENQQLAANQCVDPEEAAAHGFAYWCEGRLDMKESPAKGVFDLVATAIRDGLRWISRLARQHDVQSAEEVFHLLRSGALLRDQRGYEKRADSKDLIEEGLAFEVIRPRTRS